MSKKLQGIGASVLRKEDDRYMRGRGQFVGDIKIPGMLDVAFVRSPIAHGFIKEITDLKKEKEVCMQAS